MNSDLLETWSAPCTLSVMYVFMIYKGQQLMENRKGYDLRKPMLYWSILLAVFSIIGAVRLMTLMYDLYNEGGIHSMVCTGPIVERLIHPNWTYAFLYSKFLEYGDTVFIVFRKKPLIFLHWYHHLTVALFCWFNVQNNYAGSCIFMGLNAVIHAFMYTYYSLKAAEFKIPRVVSISITLFQIVQMLLGCSFMTYIIVMGNDSDCKTSNSHSLAGGFMYASYLVLFAQFFQRSYSSQTSSQKHSTLSETAKLEHTDGATQSDGSVRQRRL